MYNQQSAIGNQQCVIIGAGISGLCIAYWLKKKGIDVLVLERDEQVGGTMKTIRENNWLIETGPNSALETTPLFQQLFDELGIAENRIYANEAASNRYILRESILHPLPMSPPSFLKTKLFSVRGKLRLLKEPFVGRATKEESIAEFVIRRLGSEFLDYAINPFVAGVFAGSPEQLSVQAAFPKLYALEEKYGGLIKGMIQGSRERKKRAEKAKDRAKMFSFKDGMQTFPRALANALGDSIQLGCSVEHIVPMRAGKYPIYHVHYRQGETTTTIQAQTVILATPASVTANIIRKIDPAMSSTLDSIHYPPVTVCSMGFTQEQILRALDGFGYLIPEKEKRNILGTIWSSTLFPGRTPDGHVLLTSFIGGGRQPELTAKNDEQLSGMVLSELQSIIGIKGEPVFTKIIRWEKAIPQYNLGYHKILKAMERFEQNFHGAFICSNYRGGISVGDCVMSAEKMAEKIVGYKTL